VRAVSKATFLLRGSALRVTNSAIAALIGFVMMPFLVGHLGDHDYGIWTIATSLVGSYYLLDFGLADSVMRFAAVSIGTNDYDKLSRVVSTSLVVYCLLAVLVLLASIGLSIWAPHWKVAAGDAGAFRHVILITGLSMALGFPFKAYAGILQARLRYDLLSGISLVNMLAGTVAVAWLVHSGYGIVSLAYVGLVTNVAHSLVFLVMARREVPQLQVRRDLFERSLVREMASFSVWSFLIQVAGQLRFRIDALVVGSLRSASAVTQFTVGARLVEIPDGMLYQATNLVQPLLTAQHARGERERMQGVLELYTRINTTLAVFVSGMLVILGEAFIGRWMGPGYSTAVLVVYALTLARCFGFMLTPLDNSLYAIGRIRFMAMINLVDAAANVALSIWLGRKMGIVGVALGTLIPMVLTRAFLFIPHTCRQLGWPLGDYARTLGRPLSAGVGLLVLVWFVYRNMPWIGSSYVGMVGFSALSGVIYLSCMFVLGVSRSERGVIVAAVHEAVGRRPGPARAG
jgi:O-antigen/teichoic acid export membrane protein